VTIFFFHNFYNILNFDEFCRMCSFEFLNLILTKNLEIDFSFLEIFILNFSNFFKISNLTAKPVTIGFHGFHKNRLVFDDIVSHGPR
jgi:hypothetical protein